MRARLHFPWCIVVPIRLTAAHVFLPCLMVAFTAGLAPSPAHADPVQPARKVAEWEPAAGTLIRWPLGIPSSLVIELAADDSLYVLVETAGQEQNATQTFGSWGVNLDHVRFIQVATYSHWTRDWGPQDVFDGNGTWGIGDPMFEGYPWVPGCNGDHGGAVTGERAGVGLRGWEEDDVVNAAVASSFGAPLHELPAFLTGGNIMSDGQSIAFSTRQMLAENAPHWSEAQFRQLAGTYLGIDTYHFLDDPEVHGIQHIDCYAKLLDEETMLIKEVEPSHPEYDCVEDMVGEIASLTNGYGRPYEIRRVFCGPYNSWQDPAAYTNSLILNDKVLVPLFGIGSDEPALEAYRDAMPGYEVLGFHHGNWYYYDALHCRTMALFDRHMLRVLHRRFDSIVPWAAEFPVHVMIDDRSEAGLDLAGCRVEWRLSGEPGWNAVSLVAGAAPDSFVAAIPGQPTGTVVEYYVEAADLTGRHETQPPPAPAAFYAFEVGASTGIAGHAAPPVVRPVLAASPNPFRSALRIEIDAPGAGAAKLLVVDVSGRHVRTLLDGVLPAGGLEVTWDGRSDGGGRLAAGIYFARFESNAGAATRKILKAR